MEKKIIIMNKDGTTYAEHGFNRAQLIAISRLAEKMSFDVDAGDEDVLEFLADLQYTVDREELKRG